MVLIAFWLFSGYKINAQHKNNFEAGLYNIGFGGFVGGIGAMINKKPDEKTGKVFLKGFGQGALGGYLLYESKRLVGKFAETKNYAYVWPSKLVNFAGISIIENAAANRNFGEQWHLNLGFNRLEFYTKDKLKMSYRFMTFALSNTIYGFTQGTLDVKESLKIGSFVFITDKINSSRDSEGIAFANLIIYQSNNRTRSKVNIISHELIHIYQYESFSGLNSFLNKPIKSLNTNNNWVKWYSKIFYTDFNYLTFRGLYDINTDHDTNFFENEARFYTDFD
jgi:hypothetical protein